MRQPFLEPVLALCSDRSTLAKENPILPGPDSWFSANNIAHLGITGVSFDFFIDWRQPNRLDRELWLKRSINPAAIPDWNSLSESEILTILRADEKFNHLVHFAGKNSCAASAIIFDDRQDWSDPSAGLIYARWPRDAYTGKGLDIEKITKTRLEEMIRAKSGGPIKIGSKGLIYGTSRLECALSHTTALWPGDADMILCYQSSMQPIALLEFKKHTQSAKILFAQQRLSNYYPHPDQRKYDRLALLADQLKSGTQVPLFNLYYSTNPTELNILVEQVSGITNNLVSTKIVSRDVHDVASFILSAVQ